MLHSSRYNISPSGVAAAAAAVLVVGTSGALLARSLRKTTARPGSVPRSLSLQPSHARHKELQLPSQTKSVTHKAEAHSNDEASSANSPRDVRAPNSSHTNRSSPILQLPPPSNPYALAWSVFWDLENVSVPRGVSGETVVHALRSRLTHLRPSSRVVRIVAVGSIFQIPATLRNQLQANGVSLVHVETKGRKDAADKALITELCLLPSEHKPPYGVVLMSGDGDFAYALARVRLLGYTTVVVANKRRVSCSHLLESVPHFVWGLTEDVLDTYGREQEAKMGKGKSEVAVLRRRVDKLASQMLEMKRRPSKRGIADAKWYAEASRTRNASKQGHAMKPQQTIQRPIARHVSHLNINQNKSLPSAFHSDGHAVDGTRRDGQIAENDMSKEDSGFVEARVQSDPPESNRGSDEAALVQSRLNRYWHFAAILQGALRLVLNEVASSSHVILAIATVYGFILGATVVANWQPEDLGLFIATAMFYDFINFRCS